MNISAASLNSTSTGTTAATGASNSNNEISQLEKQKKNLQTEVQDLSQSKDDEKAKEKKLAALNLQIQSIDTQIQQLKSDKSKAAEAGNPETSPSMPPPGQKPEVGKEAAPQNLQAEGDIGTQLDLLV